MFFQRQLNIFLVSCLVTVMLAGCIPSTSGEMHKVYFAPAGEGEKRSLFIFLPGRWDHPARFEEEGFTAAVREAGLPVDMMAADAHMGYYLKKIFPERFRKDVILPARQRGYEQIWLIGISLGGLGALWYDGTYPGEVTGLVALAPYLGETWASEEIAGAGGLVSWNPPTLAGDDFQRAIWRGLKVFVPRDKNLSRLYLGYGTEDEFAYTNGIFAEVLPEEQVFTASGGHDWDTWRQLWAEILEQMVRQQEGLRPDNDEL